MITIAIDGPSGSGKSTIAQILADKLDLCHVNAGELYRTIGVYLYENNIDARNEEEVKKVLDNINIKVEFVNHEQNNYLNGVLVNDKLHTPIASDFSSRCAPFKSVREKVKAIQREIANNYGVVMEGRDITTEILPNAKYKYYITASAEVRAKRRFDQLKLKDESLTFNQVLSDINERDYRDTHRKLGLLTIASDAEVINTDNYTAEQVAAIICEKIKEN